jgi:hypothetical protein
MYRRVPNKNACQLPFVTFAQIIGALLLLVALLLRGKGDNGTR